MLYRALHTYVEALKKKHKGKSEYLTCCFIRDTGGAVAAGVCVPMKPAKQPIGSERTDEAGRRLYLPSGADSEGWNVLGLNSLPLSTVMWTTATTLGSLRRAVMWASGV